MTILLQNVRLQKSQSPENNGEFKREGGQAAPVPLGVLLTAGEE